MGMGMGMGMEMGMGMGMGMGTIRSWWRNVNSSMRVTRGNPGVGQHWVRVRTAEESGCTDALDDLMDPLMAHPERISDLPEGRTCRIQPSNLAMEVSLGLSRLPNELQHSGPSSDGSPQPHVVNSHDRPESSVHRH
jgi:hypothetical protein